MAFLGFMRIDDESYTHLAAAEIAVAMIESWEDAKATPEKVQKQVKQIEKDIFSNGLTYLVVEEQGDEAYEKGAVAYVAFSTSWIKDYLYLQSTGVIPEARGQGVLKSILEELKSIVRRAGLKGIVADIQSENIAPIKANLKAGFEHVTPDTLEDIPKVSRTGMTPFSLVSKKSLESGKKAMMVWRNNERRSG